MGEVRPGVVVVDKPGGMTSHDVVSRVRRLAGTRKVGHAGTLDPMATGVLVLGVGRATRLLGHLMLTDKAYDATIRLGVSTTTDDAEGELVTSTSAGDVTDTAIRRALDAFVGDIEQVPSSVSAIKVDGKRAYARVRAGEHVELSPRRVRVDAIDVRTVERHEQADVVDVAVGVRCSTGTYIRSIARDLGAALGVGGHLIALRRMAVGPFGLGDARTFAELDERFEVLSLRAVTRSLFPAYDLDEEQAIAVRHGRPLPVDLAAPGPVAVFAPEGEFLALYEQQDDEARAVAVFTD